MVLFCLLICFLNTKRGFSVCNDGTPNFETNRPAVLVTVGISKSAAIAMSDYAS